MVDFTALRLGASMYIPATQPVDKLVAAANGFKFPTLRSAIFCTEDAVRAEDVDMALDHLASALPQFRKGKMLRFIRVRCPHVLGHVLTMRNITNVDGFVLPKVTRQNFMSYANQLKGGDPFWIMPTLETPEAFDAREMQLLRKLFLKDSIRERILTIRIGGNDLLNLIAVRRPTDATIYDTAIRGAIEQLVFTFRPSGFNLSAPVFEGFRNPDVLRREVKLDLQHGLFGKTAIHPDQIADIEAGYAVKPTDLEQARKILPASADAVFKLHDVMCEPSTQRRAAAMTLGRAAIYGLVDDEGTITMPGEETVMEMEEVHGLRLRFGETDDCFVGAPRRVAHVG